MGQNSRHQISLHAVRALWPMRALSPFAAPSTRYSIPCVSWPRQGCMAARPHPPAPPCAPVWSSHVLVWHTMSCQRLSGALGILSQSRQGQVPLFRGQCHTCCQCRTYPSPPPRRCLQARARPSPCCHSSPRTSWLTPKWGSWCTALAPCQRWRRWGTRSLRTRLPIHFPPHTLCTHHSTIPNLATPLSHTPQRHVSLPPTFFNPPAFSHTHTHFRHPLSSPRVWGDSNPGAGGAARAGGLPRQVPGP